MMHVKLLNFFKKLTDTEKKTFYFLSLAQVFNGFCLGILILQEVILRKTLNGTPLQITMLTMVNPVANIFIIYMMDIFSRIKQRKMIFLLMGVFGKLILILTMFVNSSISFLIVLIIYSILNVMLNPFFTGIMQTNVRKMNRGIIYGITGSLGTVSSVLVSLFSGKILDYDPSYFRILFAFAGVAGFLCCYFYSLIKIESDSESVSNSEYKRIFNLVEPLKNAFYLLKSDKKFTLYETFFFLYGIGYMIVLPAIPIYFVDKLHLDYSQISMAKGFIGQAGIIIFLPVMGYFNDRINPMIFSALAFFLLSFYPLTLFFSQYFAGSEVNFVYGAFAVFSVSMAAVSVLWDLSSIYFAGKRDSKNYQIVHIFLTGIRGILAPLAGYLIMKSVGVFPVFIISFIFYIMASISMLILYFSYKKKSAL